MQLDWSAAPAPFSTSMARTPWAAIAVELRANAGRWARFGPLPVNSVGAIQRHLKRRYDLEVVTRRGDGGATMWVRAPSPDPESGGEISLDYADPPWQSSSTS